jgi:threonine/homoserine/homoserine lactone efflux protein
MSQSCWSPAERRTQVRFGTLNTPDSCRFGVQLAILGVSSIAIELVVLSIYVAACHRTRGFAQQARFAVPLERVGGALLIGAGLRLAATHRG